MANTRNDLDVINAKDIHDNALKPYLDYVTNTRLLMSSSIFANSYKSDMRNMRHVVLLQAVIDDNRERVQLILDQDPEILLQVPNEKLIIISRYTWQKFYAEDALTMAVKRKQIEMIQLLLPYYDMLPQTDEVKITKVKAMSAWKMYDIRKMTRYVEEIIVPPEYENYMQSLINAFAEETFPNGNDMKSELSYHTENALRLMRSIMLPNFALKLDDYIDPELMLLAAYKAYEINRDKLRMSEQQDHFCVKVIGFIQSILTPEMAKRFCHGLDGKVKKNDDTENAQYHLFYGENFYHSSREEITGLGYDYLCGTISGASRVSGYGLNDRKRYEKTMLSISRLFSEIYAADVNAEKTAESSFRLF